MHTFLSARPLESGESLSGYLLWLAEEDNRVSPITIATLLSIRRLRTKAEFINLQRAVPNLSQATGIDRHRLRDASLRAASHGIVRFNGRLVRDGFVRPTHPRYCPRCIRAVGYRHMLWDITAFGACPIHNIWLDSGCPRCGPDLHWEQTLHTKCVCGRSLLHRSVLPCTSAVSDLMHVLALHAGFEFGETTRPFSEEIISLPLSDLLAIVHGVGALAAWNSWAPIGKHGRPKDSEAMRTSILAAAGVLANWPEAFYECCRNLQGQVGRVIRADAIRADEPWRKLLSKHLIRAPEPRPTMRDQMAIGRSKTRRSWLGKRATQARLRIGVKRIDKLREMRTLNPMLEQRSCGTICEWYAADEVDSLRDDLSTVIPLGAVRKRLGLRIVHPLIDCGALKIVSYPFARGDIGVLNTSLDTLLETIERRIVRVPRSSGTRVSFIGAVSMMQARCNRIRGADIALAVLKRELIPRAWNRRRPGLAGLSFLAVDIRSLKT
jgi:TniQ